MAHAPCGCSKPGFVTRPTPGPPTMRMRSFEEQVTSAPLKSFPANTILSTACCCFFDTLAYTRIPSVTSGSSPASFWIAQDTYPFPHVISNTSRCKEIPLGVNSFTSYNFQWYNPDEVFFHPHSCNMLPTHSGISVYFSPAYPASFCFLLNAIKSFKFSLY